MMTMAMMPLISRLKMKTQVNKMVEWEAEKVEKKEEAKRGMSETLNSVLAARSVD